MSVNPRKDTPANGRTYDFNTTAQPELDLTVACEVEFVTGDAGRVIVEVEGDTDGFTVNQNGNSIIIRQKDMSSGGVTMINSFGGGGSYRSVSFSGGGVVMNGGDIIIGQSGRGSGTVVINGKRINLDDLKDADTQPAPKVRVIAPKGSTLEGTFKGNAQVSGSLEFSGAYIGAESSANVAVSVRGTLNANASSRATIRAGLVGKLKANASSSANIIVQGEFDEVEADASSSSGVRTSGYCQGDYNGSASSSAHVLHSGGIGGRQRVRESSMGQVSIN